MFANQLNLDYDVAKKTTTTITSNKGQIQVTKCQPRNIKSILKKEIEKKFEEEVKQQPWVGQYIVNQWPDEDLDKESYNIDISKIWRGILDVVFSTW